MEYLINFFTNNSYPSFVFNKILNSFLNKKFQAKSEVITVKKDIKYFKLPYLGQISFEIRKKLQHILSNTYPQIKFCFVFTNSFTTGSFLRDRPSLPKYLCSNVVYMYTCLQCGLRYLGSTSRLFSHRYLEHKGLSLRTKMPLTKPSHSAIRDHSLEMDHPFTHQDFRTLCFASNRLDLLISESLLIAKMRPELNNYSSAFELAL